MGGSFIASTTDDFLPFTKFMKLSNRNWRLKKTTRYRSLIVITVEFDVMYFSKKKIDREVMRETLLEGNLDNWLPLLLVSKLIL